MKSRRYLLAILNRYLAAFFFACFCCGTVHAASKAGKASVVLDPGHSSRSHGTTSCSGIPEHVLNYELAKSVSAYLNSYKINVMMTRGAAGHLENRKRATKFNRGDLFVALHHDSAQPVYLEPQKKGGGNCSRRFRGFSLFVSGKNRQYEKSLEYARKLADSLLSRGYSPTLHHAEDIPGERRMLLDPVRGIYRYDDLTVLKDNVLPAILFEAGVIINPEDEALVISDKFRKNIAESFLEILK